MRLQFDRGHLTIILLMYVLEENKGDKSERFYEKLQRSLYKVNTTDCIVNYITIAGNINA